MMFSTLHGKMLLTHKENQGYSFNNDDDDDFHT